MINDVDEILLDEIKNDTLEFASEHRAEKLEPRIIWITQNIVSSVFISSYNRIVIFKHNSLFFTSI